MLMLVHLVVVLLLTCGTRLGRDYWLRCAAAGRRRVRGAGRGGDRVGVARLLESPPLYTVSVTYSNRFKFFGFPLHAAYPIDAAISGTITKDVTRNSPASIDEPLAEYI